MGADAHSLEHELEKRTLVRVLQRNRSWSLGQLATFICRGGKAGARLGALTIGDLWSAADAIDDTDAVDGVRLARARRLKGPDYDAIVLEVLREAEGEWVAPSFVEDRAGGPRWKRQNSLNRLIEAGKVERTGKTSSTNYRIVGGKSGRR